MNEGDDTVDAETVAAALVVEQVAREVVSLKDVTAALGSNVSDLVESVISVRRLVDAVDLLDDVTAREIQQRLFESVDERALLLQFLSSLDALCYPKVHSHVCAQG